MANKPNGNANAAPKPLMPAVNCQAPLFDDREPTSNEPSIGPVQENETIARVRAIKKTPPILPRPDWDPILLANEEGNVISKYPKNEIANTTKMKIKM